MQITYLVKQEAKKRKLAAWKQKPLCQGLGHTDHLNQIGNMRRSVVMNVTKNTSQTIWWVLKRVVITFFGIAFDVTTYENNHSLCYDCGVCLVMDYTHALLDVCWWLYGKWHIQ
jgi:hypothetical protein